MAVINRSSTSCSNRTSKILNDANVQGGRVLEWMDFITAVSGDSATSVYRVLCGVPSSLRIGELHLTSDTIASAAADFGLYDRPDVNAGAVVDADFFTAAKDIHTAALANLVITNGNVRTTAKATQPIWQLLGLTSDPCKLYDVCATITTAATGGGSLYLRMSGVLAG